MSISVPISKAKVGKGALKVRKIDDFGPKMKVYETLDHFVQPRQSRLGSDNEGHLARFLFILVQIAMLSAETFILRFKNRVLNVLSTLALLYTSKLIWMVVSVLGCRGIRLRRVKTT